MKTRYSPISYDDNFLTSQHNDLTSQHKDLISQHKDLASRHNYLTSDGRNMPPYILQPITFQNKKDFIISVMMCIFVLNIGVWIQGRMAMILGKVFPLCFLKIEFLKVVTNLHYFANTSHYE